MAFIKQDASVNAVRESRTQWLRHPRDSGGHDCQVNCLLLKRRERMLMHLIGRSN